MGRVRHIHTIWQSLPGQGAPYARLPQRDPTGQIPGFPPAGRGLLENRALQKRDQNLYLLPSVREPGKVRSFSPPRHPSSAIYNQIRTPGLLSISLGISARQNRVHSDITSPPNSRIRSKSGTDWNHKSVPDAALSLALPSSACRQYCYTYLLYHPNPVTSGRRSNSDADRIHTEPFCKQLLSCQKVLPLRTIMIIWILASIDLHNTLSIVGIFPCFTTVSIIQDRGSVISEPPLSRTDDLLWIFSSTKLFHHLQTDGLLFICTLDICCPEGISVIRRSWKGRAAFPCPEIL